MNFSSIPNTLPPAQISPAPTQKILEAKPIEIMFRIEKIALRFFSYALLIHGSLSLYDEFIQIFYVFPYLPSIYKAANFSESVFQVILRRSIILFTTAGLETLYAVILIKKHHTLAHRIHLLSSIGLIVVSMIIQSVVGSYDQIVLSQIPTPPTVENVRTQSSFDDIITLFKTTPPAH